MTLSSRWPTGRTGSPGGSRDEIAPTPTHQSTEGRTSVNRRWMLWTMICALFLLVAATALGRNDD